MMFMLHHSLILMSLFEFLLLLFYLGAVSCNSVRAVELGSARSIESYKRFSAKNDASRKFRLLQRIRQLKTRRVLQTSELGAEILDHLVELTMDKDGNPNPRISCTEGNGYAADYIAAQMEEIGLIPLGNPNRTSYLQVVSGSVNETLCPGGIRNVLGMVPGTTFPNEIVVYSAHLDGPRNQNPQTDLTRGSENVSNAYDDGLAVAVGLGIASTLMKRPPERSVLIFIDDAEEGWSNVMSRELGESFSDACVRIRDTEWYKQVFEATGGNLNFIESCRGGLLGSKFWVQNPTTDLADIVAMFVVDPLGSSYNATTQYIAALGGEKTIYTDGTTMDDFLDEIWPQDSNVKLVKSHRDAVGGFSSTADVVSRSYRGLCGSNCLIDGGIPSLWLAQPAFQKYHSGAAVGVVKDLFYTLIGTNGTFPSPIYFSVDNMAAFFQPSLEDISTTLLQLISNAANNPTTRNLTYDQFRDDSYNLSDIENLIEALEVLSKGAQDRLPPDATQTFMSFIQPLLQQASFIAALDDNSRNSPDVQAGARQIAQATVGLTLSMDFFSANYPEKEAFIDQSFQEPPNRVNDEPYFNDSSTGTPSPTPTDFPTVISAGTPTITPTSNPSDTSTTFPTGSTTNISTGTPTITPTSNPSDIPTTFPTGSTTEIATGTPTKTATIPPSTSATSSASPRTRDYMLLQMTLVVFYLVNILIR